MYISTMESPFLSFFKRGCGPCSWPRGANPTPPMKKAFKSVPRENHAPCWHRSSIWCMTVKYSEEEVLCTSLVTLAGKRMCVSTWLGIWFGRANPYIYIGTGWIKTTRHPQQTPQFFSTITNPQAPKYDSLLPLYYLPSKLKNPSLPPSLQSPLNTRWSSSRRNNETCVGGWGGAKRPLS